MDSDLEDSEQAYEIPIPSIYDTEKLLREHLQIPETKPLNLYSLPECIDPNDRAIRPSTIALAALAIWGSDSKRLSLQEIITAIEARYPTWAWFNPTSGSKPAWKGSIRHSLTLKAWFIRKRRPGSTNKKDGIWHINVAYGFVDTRLRKRRSRPDAHSHPSPTPSPTSNHEFSVMTAPMLNNELDNHHIASGSHNTVSYGPPQTTNAQAYQYFGVASYQGEEQNYASYQQAAHPAPNSYIFIQEPYPRTSNRDARGPNIHHHAHMDFMLPVNATNMSQGSSSGRQSTERSRRARGRQMPLSGSRTRRTM
uniref:Fork-head domain-containing protein n=1 Tax=Psilocybe cubensis TaxID=181762 RepID=A0A8H7XMG5_PSICU